MPSSGFVPAVVRTLTSIVAGIAGAFIGLVALILVGIDLSWILGLAGLAVVAAVPITFALWAEKTTRSAYAFVLGIVVSPWLFFAILIALALTVGVAD